MLPRGPQGARRRAGESDDTSRVPGETANKAVFSEQVCLFEKRLACFRLLFLERFLCGLDWMHSGLLQRSS